MTIPRLGPYRPSIQKPNHISTLPFVSTPTPVNLQTISCVPSTSVSYHSIHFRTLNPQTTLSRCSTRHTETRQNHRFSSRSAITNHTSHSCSPISTCSITTLTSSITQMTITSRTIYRLWHGPRLMICGRDMMWRD